MSHEMISDVFVTGQKKGKIKNIQITHLLKLNMNILKLELMLQVQFLKFSLYNW